VVVVYIVNVDIGRGMDVATAVVQHNGGALRARVQVTSIYPTAVKGEGYQWRMCRVVCIVGRTVVAYASIGEAIQVEVRQPAAAAGVLAARIEVALLNIAVAHIVVLREDRLPIECQASGPSVRQAH
jgi:hypothetical protein